MSNQLRGCLEEMVPNFDEFMDSFSGRHFDKKIKKRLHSHVSMLSQQPVSVIMHK